MNSQKDGLRRLYSLPRRSVIRPKPTNSAATKGVGANTRTVVLGTMEDNGQRLKGYGVEVEETDWMMKVMRTMGS